MGVEIAFKREISYSPVGFERPFLLPPMAAAAEEAKMKHAEIKNKLSEEVAPCDWAALAPHSRAGRLFWVHPPLTLIEAALAFATDQKAAVQAWLSVGLLESAREEEPSEEEFQVLIVQPFVLAMPHSK